MADEKEIAEIAMQFMGRVSLQGNEVPAFNGVMKWLHDKTQPTGD